MVDGAADGRGGNGGIVMKYGLVTTDRAAVKGPAAHPATAATADAATRATATPGTTTRATATPATATAATATAPVAPLPVIKNGFSPTIQPCHRLSCPRGPEAPFSASRYRRAARRNASASSVTCAAVTPGDTGLLRTSASAASATERARTSSASTSTTANR